LFDSKISEMDIKYLNGVCKKARDDNKYNKDIELLDLLLNCPLDKITKNSYNNDKNLLSRHKGRLNKYLESTDKKGYFIEDITYKIKKYKKNTFVRFLLDIKNYIEKHKGINGSGITTIKIYDEYRKSNKKIILHAIFKFFEKNNLFSKIVIKSIANNFKTKNFLISMEKLSVETDLYIIKPSAIRVSDNACYVIIESLGEKGSKLFYYDEDIMYQDEGKNISKQHEIINKKFDNKKYYEKFDSNIDFEKLLKQLIIDLESSLIDKKIFDSNKKNIKEYLDKIKMNFSNNVMPHLYMHLIYNILEQVYCSPLNSNEEKTLKDDQLIIKELFEGDIQKKVITLLKNHVHKIA